MNTPANDLSASRPAVQIIAEGGTNHGGVKTVAESLAAAAKESGANSIKFQFIYPEGLYLPEFLVEGRYVANEVFQKRAATRLSDEEWREVAAHCRERLQLPFSASVFDRRGLNLLCSLDPPYLKIASCDLNHESLLCDAATRGRRLIVSTGMSTLSEIEQTVKRLLANGPVDLVLMHCVSVYPCSLAQMNLGFIDTLRTNFGLPVGLSDHTESSLAAAMAVAKGVTWIEKHLTLDRHAVGFDHAYAMEPAGFSSYVTDIRAAEANTLPSPSKIQPAEAAVKQRARRAVYAAQDIPAGAHLDETHLLIVRPEGPISPAEAVQVIGRETTRAFRRFEALTWDGLRA